MFNELPGFFDRNFIVGFFLPSLVFVLVGFGLMVGFGVEPKLTQIIGDDLYKGATIIGVISLIISVFLLALNFNIFRFFEGYGKYNPLKLLSIVQEKKFLRMKEKLQQLEEAQDQAESVRDDETTAKLDAQRIYLYQYAADRYPTESSRILPTAFGNAVRAFEDYSETMYGLDVIVSWVRLLAVIPADFREMMNSARAQLDMWLNFRLLSYVLIIVYLITAFSAGQFRMIWFPPVILGFAFFASVRATEAAFLYGDFVKSSYDLYIPDLRDQLRLRETDSIEAERKLWSEFSQQIIYHDEKYVIQRVTGDKASKENNKNAGADEG